jgi:mannose-1-phosphate guanylyltransferase/mannose-6-phosphate isomerase
MGVFPADHVVARPAVYRNVVRAAFQGAAAGHLMVVGILPRWPETGYGYIEFPRGTQAGAREPIPVKRFREKPALAQARRYLAAGNYYWNSGMFFWQAGVLLDQLRQHLPKTATLLASLPRFGSRQFAVRLAQAFPLSDNISIDYAVMEKAGNVHGIAAADFGWNDVGSWNAVYELLTGDSDGNVVAGKSVCLDSHHNFVEARGKTVALLGVDDLIVVDTPDALLVTRRDLAQKVGDVVKALERQKRDDLL